MDYYNLKKENLIEEILRLKQENDLLSESGGGFKFIFENSGKAIIIINDKGKILNSNKAAKSLFGSRDTKKNKSSLREFRCSDGSGLLDNVLKSAETGRFRQEVSINGELAVIDCEVLFNNKSNIICVFNKEQSDAYLQNDLNDLISGHYDFFNSIDAGINIIGRDFRIKYSNDSVKKLNSENQNSANRKCFEIYGKSKQNGQCDKCPIADTFTDGAVHRQIIPLGNSHGYKSYQVTSLPIKDGSGGISAAIEFITDTRKNINDSAKFDEIFFTKDILDSLPVPVFIKNTNGRYLTCNKEFTRYFHLEEKDIAMKNDTELFGKHFADIFAHSDFETIKNGKFEEYLDSFIISDNQPSECFLVRKTLCKSDGDKSLIIGAATDITETKNIQNELIKQKNYIFNIIENANVMIIGLDLEGNITLFNKMAENITGYSREEIMGKNYFDYIVPRDKFPGVYESFIHFSHSKVIKFDNFENYIYTKSGEEKYISWRDSATVEGNKVTGIISFGIDLSFSRYERETLRRFTMAAELSDSAILIADINGSIKYINPAFTKITGYSFDEVKGKNSLYFKSRMTDSDAFNKLWKKIKSGQNFKGEFKFKRKNGEQYWESNSISPIKDESGEITDIIVIKNEITKYKNSLENMNGKKDKEKETIEYFKLLISDIINVIKIPLDYVMKEIEILRSADKGSDDIEYLLEINKKLHHISRMTNYFAEIAKPDSGDFSVNIKEHNLVKIFGELLSGSGVPEIDDEKGFLNSHLESGILVSGDGTIIRLILDNLLTDIAIYKAEHPIKIEVKKTAEMNNFFADIIISCKNSVMPENDAALFKKSFEDNNNPGIRVFSGLAKLLGGSVNIQYYDDAKLKYIFRLPLSDKDVFSIENSGNEKINENITPALTAADALKPRILFSAENEINIKIAVSLLQKHFDIDIAANIEEASMKHNAHKYDIILIDVNPQSEKNIFMLLKEIRSRGIRKGIPVIAVSNYDVISERKKLLNAGFTDYLARPFTKGQLLYIINKYI